MRYIDEKAIDQMAIGAAFLGTGGGGDPFVGRMMALTAIAEYGPVQLLDPEEIDPEGEYACSAMIGAPSVSAEKIPTFEQFIQAVEELAEHLHLKKVDAIFPIEAGGINSMIPIAVAAALQIPLVDIDGMGRAFPELQMSTFGIAGISAGPLALSDEKGNVAIINPADNMWSERLSRVLTVEMGASAAMSLYQVNGEELYAHGIHRVMSFSEKIGEVISGQFEDEESKLNELLKLTEGYQLFQGKIVDVIRKTEGGFNRGEAVIEGLGPDAGDELRVSFQNEYLLAEKDGRVQAVTPDLITMVDLETMLPLTVDGLSYGTRLRVLALPCDEKWRTDIGIETVGPRYFGYDCDYVPVEQLVREGED